MDVFPFDYNALPLRWRYFRSLLWVQNYVDVWHYWGYYIYLSICIILLWFQLHFSHHKILSIFFVLYEYMNTYTYIHNTYIDACNTVKYLDTVSTQTSHKGPYSLLRLLFWDNAYNGESPMLLEASSMACVWRKKEKETRRCISVPVAVSERGGTTTLGPAFLTYLQIIVSWWRV